MFSQLRLLKYVRPHWRHLIAMLLTMGVGIGLEVLRPWPTKLLVDQVLGGQPMSATCSQILQWLPGPGGVQGLLLWVCISTVLIFVLGTLMTTISTLASVQLGQSMTYDLGADLFLHVQRLSLLFHSRRSVGDTLSRVTGDAYCVQSLVTGAIVPVIRATGTLIAMFAVMWKLQPWMTLMSLGVAPFMLLSIRMFGKSMKQRTRERRDLEGQMTAVVQRALSAIPVVQAFAREEIEYERFRSYAGKTVAAYRRGTMAGMWFRFSVGLVTAVGTAGIMWLGARFALQGSISVGTILVFLAYLASLYAPLTEIAYTASTWQGAAASSDRVIEVLTTEPKVADSPTASDVHFVGHVQYEGVSFGYDADRPVLEDITFDACPGEVIAIVGPTGAGKTTLVNLLVRFFDPSSGRILIDGRDLRDLKIKCIRNQVAMVLQEPFIFPLTAAENIAYGRLGATREEIIQAAIAAEADGFIRKLPEGYDSVIGERGATLSGGEKQRLSIARAFLKNAPILVLDEPTSSLDVRTESLLLGAMSRLTRGRTTFIIAHRLSTIRNASRILVLDGGRIVEQGRHSELLPRGGLYSTLYRQQMEIARHDVRPEPAHVEAVV